MLAHHDGEQAASLTEYPLWMRLQAQMHQLDWYLAVL